MQIRIWLKEHENEYIEKENIKILDKLLEIEGVDDLIGEISY